MRKKKEDLLIVHENYDGCWPNGFGRGIVPMRFTIGLKYKGKVNHVVVDAEDASSPPSRPSLNSRKRRSCMFVRKIVGATSGILL